MFKLGDIVINKKTRLKLRIINDPYKQFWSGEYQYHCIPIDITGFPRYHYESELVSKKIMDYWKDFEEIINA